MEEETEKNNRNMSIWKANPKVGMLEKLKKEEKFKYK